MSTSTSAGTKLSPSRSRIDEILLKRRIIITCGTGGVGKTTLSAALAVRAATLGKRAAVITIDPAKRLATSLGVESLGDRPADLTSQLKMARERAERAGLPVPSEPVESWGTLAAIMPDTRRTFEAFVHTLSPNPALAERVIRNPIFQIFAKEFSGTNEYMALERLYALDSEGEYDLIVLDTPPSRNTLAFLDAPQLLNRLFEEKLIKWLVLPANKLVASGMKKALGILEKLTGAGFMGHLFDFASAIFEVRAKFSANLERILELLASQDVGFLLVAVPAPDTAPEAAHFVESVREHGFHFDGVALNRTLGYLAIDPSAREGATPEIRAALDLLEALERREKDAVARLAAGGSPSLPVYAKLPELARDVHSVEDLFHVAMAFHVEGDRSESGRGENGRGVAQGRSRGPDLGRRA